MKRIPKKKKILFILHGYYNKGGVEEHVKNLTSGLSHEFEVALLFPDLIGGKSFAYLFIKNGVVESSIPGKRINWPVSEFEDVSANYALESTIKKFSPDLIHIHHLHNWPLNTLDLILKFNLPVIKSIHDYFLATPLFTMEFSSHPKELLEKEYSKNVFGMDISEYLKKRRIIFISSLSKVKEKIVPSLYAKNEFSKILPAEYKIIEHGINHFNRRSKISSKKIRFGYIGSFIRQKGFEVLLKAFSEISKEFNHEEIKIELHLFGGGKEYVEDNIKGLYYQGTYSSKDLPEIVSTIDIGIIPSIFKETYCYTLSELLYAEIPVISSNIGAMTDRIKEANLSEYLFEAGNVKDLVSKIKLAISNNLKNKKIDYKVKSEIEMINEYKNLYYKYL